jgi:translation initiation factor 6 (eIF-6)
MALDPQLKSQLMQVVTVQFTTGTVSIAGELTVGTATGMFARYEAAIRTFERTNSILIFDASTGFTPNFGTRFLLPGQDGPHARQAKFIQAAVDERGRLDHFEVWL